MVEVERRELIEQLDATLSRVVLLVAPAGYGKTTLARQWVASRNAAWYQADSGAADVAALAVGLARAAATIVPGIGRELMRRLHAVSSPHDDAIALASTFAQELESWPHDAWLVFDDYHLTMETLATESFVATLIEQSPIRLLVTTRRRPRWARTRQTVYGEICELGTLELAFRESESLLLLGHLPGYRRTALIERSRGWPAVIALGARSPDGDLPNTFLPNTLHRYFAEELFQAAEKHVQDALVRLAILPRLSPSHLLAAVGPGADEICQEAVTLGFLSLSPDQEYELHPLLRTYLISKARKGFDSGFVDDVVAAMVAGGHWDDAFCLIRAYSRPDLLPALLESGVESLIDTNRFSTLAAWVEYGASSGCGSPFLDLAEAELARRGGNATLGEARALQAATKLTHPRHKYRAFVVMGACAQRNMRMEAAAAHYQAAEQFAMTPGELLRTLWGRFIAEIELEREDQGPLIADMARHHDGTLTATIRLATAHLFYAMRHGGIATEVLVQSSNTSLITRDVDPFMSTLFLCHLAHAYATSAHYADALRVANSAIEEARATGLDFAVPHCIAAQAAANIGLRRVAVARALTSRLATDFDDRFQGFNGLVLSARAAAIKKQGADEVLQLLNASDIDVPTRSLRGEWLGLRAIALAATGNHEEALRVATVAEATSVEIQSRTLAGFARAIIAIDSGATEADQAVSTALDILLNSEDFDNVVFAYRIFPRLLVRLLAVRPDCERVICAVIGRARDTKLAADLGIEVLIAESHSKLSRRERQVYALICEGMTNREIASSLYISEATAKVHVRRILEKLNVRSRTEAALLQET